MKNCFIKRMLIFHTRKMSQIYVSLEIFNLILHNFEKIASKIHIIFILMKLKNFIFTSIQFSKILPKFKLYKKC